MCIRVILSEFLKTPSDRHRQITFDIRVVENTDRVMAFDESPSDRDESDSSADHARDGAILSKLIPEQNPERYHQRERRDIVPDEHLIMDRLERAAGDHLLVEDE